MKQRDRPASTGELPIIRKSLEEKEECEYKSNFTSCPNLFKKISRMQRRINIKIVKRWKREFYSKLSPAQLEEYKKKKKPKDYQLGIKYGRLLMILLAIVSIPMDAWKLYEGIQKSERAIDGPTPFEVFDYYSATISTHVVGLAAAIEKHLVITLLARLVSTFVYQSGITRGNSSIPTDPKELHKYIRDHVPKHRLPKGYKPIDPETIQSSVPNMKNPYSKASSKKSSKTKSKKGKGPTSSSKKATSKATPKRTKSSKGASKIKSSKEKSTKANRVNV